MNEAHKTLEEMRMKALKFVRGELIGRPVLATHLADDRQINGKIVDETRDTLVVEKGEKRMRLPKENYSFEFTEGEDKVRIKGSIINKRPEDRLKIKVRW